MNKVTNPVSSQGLVERLRIMAPSDRPKYISCADSTTQEMNRTINEAADRIASLEAALTNMRPWLEAMKRQGEDNIWRPAERHLATIDALNPPPSGDS